MRREAWLTVWAALLLVFVLLTVTGEEPAVPTPAAPTTPTIILSNATWPASRETVCVERHNDHYWGVVNATRIYNEVGAGQPKFRVHDDCPYFGSVHVYDVWRPDWPYGGAAWVTSLGGNTTRVVIRMNDASPARAHLSGDRTRRWKRYATGHEFGHALGLHHNSVVGSIMCYETDYYTNNGSLWWSDRRALRNLY